MCLYIGNNKVQTAKEDIICYKAVISSGKSYRSPCELTFICKQSKIENFIFKDKSFFPLWVYVLFSKIIDLRPQVSRGGIHTFSYLQDAKIYFVHNKNVHIFECVIPKGTKYIKGNFTSAFAQDDSYASEEIQFIKRIK